MPHIRELVWVAVSFRVYAILCVLRDIIACVLVTLMEMLNRKVFGRGAVLRLRVKLSIVGLIKSFPWKSGCKNGS